MSDDGKPIRLQISFYGALYLLVEISRSFSKKFLGPFRVWLVFTARCSPARSPVALVMLLACSACAFALDPKLDVSQYAHNAWKVREGFSKGRITSITQTPDGYLWLGTDSGLYRFDGVKNSLWQPPAGQQLPSSMIWNLLATHDGTLWIGTDKGLASLKDGKLAQYGQLAGFFVFSILEDRDGTVWSSGYGLPSGRLCAIHSGSIHCDASLGPGVLASYEDRKGNLWLGVSNGLWRWKPGTPTFYPMPDMLDSIHTFAEDDTGALLFTTRNGLKRLADGKIESYPLPHSLERVRVYQMLRDRDRGLWLATTDHGVVHVHEGRTDVFSRSNGLTADSVTALFEDREGNIWAATSTGLDRFRTNAVATISVDQGLSNAFVSAVLATRDGSVWLSTPSALDRWNNGEVTRALTGDAKVDGKINAEPNSLFQDRRGRIWVSTVHGFGYLENGKFVSIRAIPAEPVHGIAEDNVGNLWISEQNSGLFRLSPRGEVTQISWAGLGHKDGAYALLADPIHGGLWLGFFQGGILYFNDDGSRVSYGTGDGLGDGTVSSFRLDGNGTLWVATAGGLSRFKNGHFATLTTLNGLPCNPVHWMIEDDDHAIWLHMGCGLVRLSRFDLDAWIAAVDKGEDGKQKVQITVFDGSDGVITRALPYGYRPMVTKSLDGKIWFAGEEGAYVLDPRHIPLNKVSPPVHIEQITADHKTYDLTSDAREQLRLPPRIRDLTIDYAALSFVAPEKIHFRYKLEGQDPDWREVVNDRRVSYTNLSPKHYRFRVLASNNSGVWNEEGASLDFVIPPAWYQTNWFRALCASVFLALVWMAYETRVRRLRHQFAVTLDARVGERTRIARELHDTLLQSLHGLLLSFQRAANLLPDRPVEAKERLEGAIDQAAQAITEGRDAVQGLRSSTVVTNELAEAIRTLGEELAAKQTSQNPPLFDVAVEGTPRDLNPILRDDVYRIAGEAVRNAFLHADARHIEVELHYDERRLRLRIRDDGKGVATDVFENKGRSGHWGLQGMRERAKLVGGQLEIWSELDSGTEIELSIQASAAYADVPGQSRKRTAV